MNATSTDLLTGTSQSSFPPTTFQSVSLSSLAHRRPVLGAFVFRFLCDLKRNTPPPGERVHALPQPGHSTSETPLCSKRLISIGTPPENVHVSDAATSDTAFLRDGVLTTCSVEGIGGIFCSSFGEEVCSACFSPICTGSALSARSALTLGPTPSMIQRVLRRSTSSVAAFSSISINTSVDFASYDHSRAVFTSFIR